MRSLRTIIAGWGCIGGALTMPAQTVSAPKPQPTTAAQTAATTAAQTTKPILHVTGAPIEGLMLTKVAPIYPPTARKKGIQGTVVLHAIIGRDGHIQTLEVISGPEELRGATLDAVRQWVYKPYLLNGLPTEVDTKIMMNFRLDADTEADSVAEPEGLPSAQPVKRIPRISSGMMAKLLVTKVEPIYPEFAREHRIQGSVTLHVIVGKDGHVAQLEVVSGPRVLGEAATAAVRQWTYKKYFLNGEPSEVETMVILNFNLAR